MAQSRKEIKHVWFDLNETLAVRGPEFHAAHDKLRHHTYAKATGKDVTPELKAEFEALYKEHGTNSATFRSLGLPSGYWIRHSNALDEQHTYTAMPEIYQTFERLKDIVPISLFTNNTPSGVAKTLRGINVQEAWFTHIITGDDVPERKPNLHGFRLMIEKSRLPADQLLYVGDRVKADILPAKAVGMQTCLVYAYSDEADYSFEKFEQILTLFA
jgi:HAD superfamily hydrolase (TIGR01549 family)